MPKHANQDEEARADAHQEVESIDYEVLLGVEPVDLALDVIQFVDGAGVDVEDWMAVQDIRPRDGMGDTIIDAVDTA